MRKTIYLFVLSLLLFGTYNPLRAQCTKVKTLTNITMENGSCIHSINGYNFIMEADANGTSSLIDRNTTNHVTHAAGSQSQDQLYVVGENWHYVSSPVQDEGSGMFLDMYLYDWDETSQTWSWNAPVNIPLTPMKGWALWSPASVGSTTRTFEGDFNTGNQSYSLTRNDPNGACPVGANLVGNPYPSSLNWESASGWTETNVSPTIYLWNSTTGNTGTYNKATNISQNGVDSIIPPKQGFFVSVTGGNTSGSLGIGNDARVHNLNRAVYKAGKKISIPNVLQLNVASSLNSYSDETLIVFNKKATDTFDDQYDAFKIKGAATAPQLYTDWYGTEYAVNTLQAMDENLVIPLHFEAGVNGVYSLEANTDNLPVETEVYLEDTQVHKFQNLRTSAVYVFPANKTDAPGRFLIHFAAPDGINETSANLPGVNVFSFQKDIYVNTPLDFRGEVKVYDMLGKELTAQNIQGGENIIPMDRPADYYIVRVFSTKQVKSYKIFIK